jgi:hypothetical protein
LAANRVKDAGVRSTRIDLAEGETRTIELTLPPSQR